MCMTTDMKGRILLAMCLLILSFSVEAQTQNMSLGDRIDSLLHVRYFKVRYDTTYIGRPSRKLTMKVRANVSGNSVHEKGDLNGVHTRSDLHTSHKATLSFGVNYMGISAGLAINPANLAGKNKDVEFNVNAYSRRLSVDASYQMSKTLAGNIEQGDKTIYVEHGYIDMKILNIAGYYTFNHKRFSYPAAFTQSYIQKRSAGSWLVGLSYQGGVMKTTDEVPAGVPQVRIYSGHFALGGGCAYNFVIRKKLLIHISFLPTIVVLNRNNITVNGERRFTETHFPDLIFNERLALVYTFNEKHFAGATFVISSTLFRSSDILINQNKWRLRAFFGFRI